MSARRFLTASVGLVVFVLVPAFAAAQATEVKRAASANQPPWQAKPKKTVPTMVALTPADPPDEALPALAAAPVDVKVRTSVPAQEEAASPTAPRSSLDYERAASPMPAAAAAPNLSRQPWAAPSATPAASGQALAMAATATAAGATTTPAPGPSGLPSWTADAFIGKTAPMPCHVTRYQVIIDDRSGLVFPKLCEQPDGTFRFAP